MFNRIMFGGTLSPYFSVNLSDLTRREYTILLILVTFTVLTAAEFILHQWSTLFSVNSNIR